MVDAIDSKSILGCQGAGSSPVIGKLVLLDFDGLLVDTEKLHYLGYKEALAKRGLFLDIDFITYSGLAHDASGTALKDFVYKLYPSLQEPWEDIRKDKIALYSSYIEAHVDLMPFVPEFLHSLEKKQIPTCVVTNSPKKNIDLIKKHQPLLNTIPIWLTREDYKRPKPYPDGYLKALSLFPHIHPKDATGLEDTLRGVEALKLAHIHPILICASAHPQLKDAKNVQHFTSLEFLIS